jgi:hypothetical protein
MSTITAKASEQLHESDYLRNLFAGDDKPVIYTTTRRVSASGMTRHISLFYVKGGEILNITYSAGKALGWRLLDSNGNRAISVQGTGMDMGFHTVYTLSRTLYASSDGVDAGYRLGHRWL